MSRICSSRLLRSQASTCREGRAPSSVTRSNFISQAKVYSREARSRFGLRKSGCSEPSSASVSLTKRLIATTTGTGTTIATTIGGATAIGIETAIATATGTAIATAMVARI